MTEPSTSRVEQFFNAFKDEAIALVHQKVLSRDDASNIASAFARIAADLMQSESGDRKLATLTNLADKWGPYQVIRDFGMALKVIEKMYGDCSADDQPRFKVGLQCASEAARNALDENREHLIPPAVAAPSSDAQNAKRYQWLRVHGAALAGSYHQKEGLVRRFGNLDEEIDREMNRG